MFKLIIFIYLSLIFADIPNGYYNSAEGLEGNTLKIALHNIIDNHDSQSYGSLHDHFESTDHKSNGTVWDMYSDVPNGNPSYVYHFVDSDHCGNYSGEGDCYNREHTWPQSWFNSGNPMKSDLFHVYPTDGYVNSHRGSYPYGDVGSASWTSTNGSKKGNCSNSGYNGIVFEPIDEYKGDIARTYFYMSTRYYNEDSSWDNTDMTNGAEIKSWAITVLLNWHQLDPVSEKEINRNDEIYDIQDNRNPFIDHPEWVDCIWTDVCNLSIEDLPQNKHNKPIVNIFQEKSITILEMEFEHKQEISIDIVNVNGQHINHIFNGISQTGINRWEYQHSSLPSGIYFFSININNEIISQKFIIHK
jgi:endonuclease I